MRIEFNKINLNVRERKMRKKLKVGGVREYSYLTLTGTIYDSRLKEMKWVAIDENTLSILEEIVRYAFRDLENAVLRINLNEVGELKKVLVKVSQRSPLLVTTVLTTLTFKVYTEEVDEIELHLIKNLIEDIEVDPAKLHKEIALVRERIKEFAEKVVPLIDTRTLTLSVSDVGSNIIEASGTSPKGLSVTTYMVIELEDDQIKVKPVTVKVTEMFDPTTRLKIIPVSYTHLTLPTN